MTDTILAWHFLPQDKRLQWGKPNRKPLKVGDVRHVGSTLEMCKRGLHASIRPLDALEYAPGTIVCRVECSGKIIQGGNKLVCSRRKILWMEDATQVLQEFARWCALQVVDLWDCPEVVRHYLETGDESIRYAAWAAWDATRVTRAAAWAARDAAWDATRAAAWDAIRASAWATAWEAQNTKLESMLLAKMGGK